MNNNNKKRVDMSDERYSSILADLFEVLDRLARYTYCDIISSGGLGRATRVRYIHSHEGVYECYLVDAKNTDSRFYRIRAKLVEGGEAISFRIKYLQRDKAMSDRRKFKIRYYLDDYDDDDRELA